MRRLLISCVCLFAFAPSLLQGQESAKTDSRLQAMEERIRSLEDTVATLKAALEAAGGPAGGNTVSPAAPEATAIAQAPAEPAPSLGGAAGMGKALNPDISVIGNFIGAAGRNDVAAVPSLSLHESEFGFQAIVDPYARADFFVSFGPDGADVEEGYLTLTSLPGGFLGKVGRMRENFGKLNPLHNHVLPWIDRPLISANLLGGDDGIADEGLFVSHIIPAPGQLFLEGSAEVYHGTSGDLFQSNKRSDLSSVFRLRSYKDLSESTNLEVAGSFARGHNDADGVVGCLPPPLPAGGTVSGTPTAPGGSDAISRPCFLPPNYFRQDYHTQLAGFDSTLRWKPLRRAIYHSFIARGEAVWSRREQYDATQHAFGWYASADYQFARRWYVGTRFDWAERARDAAMHDSGQSIVLTYWPSEFSQIRGQFRRTDYAEGTTANEFLFQFQYSIGAHGAHPF